MFNLYDKVVITAKNIHGTIVDITEREGKKIYTVESDIKGNSPESYGGVWPLYDCHIDEIRAI